MALLRFKFEVFKLKLTSCPTSFALAQNILVLAQIHFGPIKGINFFGFIIFQKMMTIVCILAGAKGGLSWAKNLLVVLGIISYIVHGVGIFLDPSWYSFVIYVRNLFYGFSLLFATILILDFLSFHPLFGPWGIIIGELLMDVGKVISNFSL